MTRTDSLRRFIVAQDQIYRQALEEIGNGAKRSHWMWFIFPQVKGLGRSAMAQRFAIVSLDEARAYLDHSLLGARYIECVSALQDLMGHDPVAVFGDIDAVKLRSSLTLFEAASGNSLFGAALDRWFSGQRDDRTLAAIGAPA